MLKIKFSLPLYNCFYLVSVPLHVADHLEDRAIAIDGEDLDNGAEACDPSDKDDGCVVEDEVVEPPSDIVQNEILTGADSVPISQEDAPKKSYASIVSLWPE